ncbi:MarP family serine protease [Corynebacterium poyangense]|uniref:MarP family serine protease n=1 Tax=Corynebacterium poyangense TaxID=2684405 RepID=A0A7H0SLM4_9CORY|nr:MarP family serine protease [Corynebacterium poyangense]MBZ8177550.1 MarP family serine protease [Corynebacterium poyangense]QNQ89449.1 MarP family serine protease [Corynebacterium poyangense]
MTASLIIDLILLIAVIITLFAGWRMGAVTSIFSTVGVISGLVGAAMLAPFVMEKVASTSLRILFALGLIVLLVALGNLIGTTLGAWLRNALGKTPVRSIDSLVGGILQPVATLLVAWLVAHPLAMSAGGDISSGIQGSKILAATDKAVPERFHNLPDRISAMLSESGLPPIMGVYQQHAGAEVDPPDQQIVHSPVVNTVRPSVIHVMGDAEMCSRRLMGSGFVASPHHVITNAHVVAGTNRVNLDTVHGVEQAQVVYYNPEVDLAVLYAPNLDLPALPWAEEPAQTGDDALVLGFPESGPFSVSPARVREKLMIAGPDIYAQGRVEREAYTLRGSVRQGNSGGPVINSDGEVIGVVFGAAVDNSDTGYAITRAEVLRQIGDLNALTAPVATGQCVLSAQH